MRKWIRVLEAYITFCFLMAVLSAGIVAVDCIGKAQNGAFSLLPELNLVQYTPDRNETMEERLNKYYEREEYTDENVYDGVHWKVGIPSYIVAASLTSTVCNLVVLYIVKLFDCKMHRAFNAIFAVTCGICIVIAAIGRIAVKGCFYESIFRQFYFAAYLNWRDVFIPIFALAILTAIVKLTRREKNATDPKDEQSIERLHQSRDK